MKTNREALANLFDRFAEELNTILTEGKSVVDKTTGEIVQVSPDASTLNVVRQFLKDMDVSVAPNTNETVNSLAANLPFDGREHVSDEDGDYGTIN